MLRYLLLCLITVPALAGAQSFDTSAGRVTIERIARGFDTPWSLAFLPDDGGVLVTERDGALLHVAADGSRTGITGLPDVYNRNQGGLFDVVVARDHAETGAVFLSYAEDWGRTEGTTLAVATLNLDAKRL
ncbi:MAG: PQQ-dependent sugar dehydrogenase, partial [Pseudomonadota bacterium]